MRYNIIDAQLCLCHARLGGGRKRGRLIVFQPGGQRGDFSGTAVLHAFCGFQQFRSILDACSGVVFHPTSGACAPSLLRGPGTNPARRILQRACVL